MSLATAADAGHEGERWDRGGEGLYDGTLTF